MGIYARRSAFARARVLLVALMVCCGVLVSAAPAHADADNVENRLCLDAGGFGVYGVTAHVHITDTTGTYHISSFGQASAFTYTSGANYCYQTSATLGCTTYVRNDVYQNGFYLSSSPLVSGSGVHSVSTGTHSYGTSAAQYLVETQVDTSFGNSCESDVGGITSTYDYN